MITEQQQEQASLYAVGALTADERGGFEADLRGNAELRRLVRELQRTMDLFTAASTPLTAPPSGLRDKVLQRIEPAASGPVLGRLTSSHACTGHRHVLVDHRPSWMAGTPASPGDFLAKGHGRCEEHGVPTRWAYFVAAPGFGAERQVGIPSSGLYVVVAVLHDSDRAPQVLDTLLDRTSFGGVSFRDFVAAARESN